MRSCKSIILSIFIILFSISGITVITLELQKPYEGFGNPVSETELGGKDRILAYVYTDKPIYREGEKVYMRTVALDAAANLPLRKGHPVQIEISGPKGDIVFRTTTNLKDSVAGTAWNIPAKQPGGRYTLSVSCNGSPTSKRVFEIRTYTPPRLKTQIEFIRKGYGPSDSVSALVKVKRAEGGLPSGASVTAIARVDGQEVFRNNKLTVNSKGYCTTTFSLPDSISVGDGTLSFVIEDGGVKETASKTIPILLQTMDIGFYPESGELICGRPGRVYLQARRPDGKPADIKGKILKLNDKGQPENDTIHAVVETLHEGRGIFTITPHAGMRYGLVLDKPSGINKVFPLPSSQMEGALIRTNKPVFSFEESIQLLLSSTLGSKATRITLCKRERILDQKAVFPGKEVLATLDAGDAEGVLIATLWDSSGQPLAERLVFREPRFKVHIKITPESKTYVPGGTVKLNIETTDANGLPIESVVGLTVTDDTVLEMIEKREHAPRLPVMVYLENEVGELADPHVYFDKAHLHSKKAIDLLLGTQGWRRFIQVRFPELLETYTDMARRALAQMGPTFANMYPYENDFAGPIAMRQIRDDERLFRGGRQAKGRRENKNKKNNKQVIPHAQRPRVKMEKALGFLAEGMNFDAIMMEKIQSPIPYYTIREYAHQARPDRKSGDRLDFTETLYWNAGIRTNARTGKVTVTFDLSDSVTTFRVLADAFGNNGALGTSNQVVESVKPFYIEPKIPSIVTAGDTIEIPVALINATDQNFETVHLLAQAKGLVVLQGKASSLHAGRRERQIVTLKANQAGTYPIILSASADGYTDTVTKNLVVTPRGFPRSISQGGLIGPDNNFSMPLEIPQTIENGSLVTSIKVYPTPLANMEEALNALLREPYGCFEQTSSTTYPLIMAQQYFMSHQGIDPEKIKKAQTLLEKGYQRLIGFECKENGYEWFGKGDGHDALTAYGLLEFIDMAKVMKVDEAMLKRTREWLLGKRDNQGGFKLNKKALDSFGRAPADTTQAYIVWSLIESGEDSNSLAQEIARLKQNAIISDDSYVIALAANVLFTTGDTKTATLLVNKLVQAIQEDGHVGNGKTSITQSGGQALQIETTSLSVLAWLKKYENYTGDIEQAMQWMFENCKQGRFGSTQSTVLALKAINAYDQARAKPKASGKVQLFIDGRTFGQAVAFDQDTKGTIELPDIVSALTAGKHQLALKMEDGAEMPFSVNIQFNTRLPVSSKDCELILQTSLSHKEIMEGEPTEMQVRVSTGNKHTPTPIAIVGIPSGLTPRHDQLKELVDAGRIAAYEVTNNTVVLYWRALQAESITTLPISLTADIPGTWQAEASRAYLYYTDENKTWNEGQSITVVKR